MPHWLWFVLLNGVLKSEPNLILKSGTDLCFFQSRKINFGPSKAAHIPALYQWLSKFQALLVAKFGLYFHDVLCKQGDMKPLQAKASIDFYSK